MPRTVDAEVHKVRRDAFLDVAQRLIQTRGYERMSIQDVLDELETSKGALYHYFDSKEALLDGVVERFSDVAMAQVQAILDDPALPALRKLEQVVRGIASFKAEHRDLMLAIIEVWSSDANALVREKMRRLTAERLGPIMGLVVRQGLAEGTIHTDWPDDTAQIVVLLAQSYQDAAGRQFAAVREGGLTFADVLRSYKAMTDAVTRILGAASGSLQLVDEATLRFWFDDQHREESR